MNAKKNTQNPATKATEIQMLEEIHSLDGYLADSISQDTLQTMTSNIRSDFPVFMGTSLDPVRMERLQGLNVELEARIASRDLEIADLQERIKQLQDLKFDILVQAISSGVTYLFDDFYTQNEILRAKLQKSLDLDDSDRAALLRMME